MQGVKEGWTREKPLNVNAATKPQLEQLPGVTPQMADAIIADRPFNDSSELLSRHIVPKSVYDNIADKITAQH